MNHLFSSYDASYKPSGSTDVSIEKSGSIDVSIEPSDSTDVSIEPSGSNREPEQAVDAARAHVFARHLQHESDIVEEERQLPRVEYELRCVYLVGSVAEQQHVGVEHQVYYVPSL